MRSRISRRLIAATLGLTALTGCKDGWDELFKPKPAEESPPRPADPVDPLVVDTIGQYAVVADTGGLRVRGFSLVIGLGENGSSGCPASIREYLVDQLNRQVQAAGLRHDDERPRFSADRLIDSLDSAVVQVAGIVPGGAPKGTVFDVRVEAVPGTQTRSLEGGLLLPCELRIFDITASGQNMLAGRIVGRAGGPVFVNPFTGESGAPAGDLGRGWVLGGAASTEERTTRLVLNDTSYTLAGRIRDRLNDRFGARPPTADAQSKGAVTLHTPAAYARRPERFALLAPNVFLDSSPAFGEARLRALLTRLSEPNAPYELIALQCEAAGRGAVPLLKPQYAHSDPYVSFYAARTGLRLKDGGAVAILAQIAGNRQHPLRVEAARELGDSDIQVAAQRLVPLLDNEDQQVRIAAYEGLVRARHPVIRSRRIPCALDPEQVNVTVDLVESSAPPMIYARRTREPRIAVFGLRTPVITPMFYSHPADVVTVNAADERGDLTVFARERYGRKLNDRVVVAPRVVDLIAALVQLPTKDEGGRMKGVALSYSQTLQVLQMLCKDGVIPAEFVLEQVDLERLFGPDTPLERPETDAEAKRASEGGDAPLVPPDSEPPDENSARPEGG
jgi:hypothetical protein